jgi:Ca2+-binding RTX toxin-like protein
MATFAAGPYSPSPGVGVDMSSLDFGKYRFLVMSTKTGAVAVGDLRVTGDQGYVVEIDGSGLKYSRPGLNLGGNGNQLAEKPGDSLGSSGPDSIVGGTINRIVERPRANFAFDLHDFSIPVTRFNSYQITLDTQGALADILGSNDSIIGGANRDTLLGFNGNDGLSGGNGDDFLRGSAGYDVIDGGPGAE